MGVPNERYSIEIAADHLPVRPLRRNRNGQLVPPAPELPGAVKRYSNAHIVELLEKLQDDTREIKSLLSSSE